MADLNALLQGNPVYSDALAEQVLQQYLRVHKGYIRYLVETLCVPPEDVVQDLRITLWRQWTRYQQNSNISLKQWLSWRIRHHFKSTIRKELRRISRIPTVSLEAILEDIPQQE